MKIKIKWINRNNNEEGIRIWRSDEPFDSTQDMTALATLEPGSTEYEDDTVIQNGTYYYRVEVFRGEDSVLGPERMIRALAYTGVGPQELLRGDYTLGFFGFVDHTEFYNADELAFLYDLPGTSANQLIRWMKMAVNGKILMVPTLPIRYNATWMHLYQAGAVYGTDDFGPNHPVDAGVVQSAILDHAGDYYRVRLPKGLAEGVSPETVVIGESGLRIIDNQGAELNRILYSMASATPLEHDGVKLDTLVPAELLWTDAYTTLCQEARGVGAAEVLVRSPASNLAGGNFVPNATPRPTTVIGSSTARYTAWRPILEYVPE